MEQGSSGQPFYLNDSDSCTVDQLKTSDLRSLGDNVKLLAVIQNLSHDLVSKSENTYKKLDEIQRETEIKSVGVKNLINEFQMLADSQFIENRIYDADQTNSLPEEPSKSSTEEEKSTPDQKILPIIHECISNSLKFIDDNFNLGDKLAKQSAESDEEDDYIKETLARAMESNCFNKTPLPAIIGSSAFFNQDIFNDGENRLPVQSNDNHSELSSDRHSSISADSDEDDATLFLPNKAISIKPGTIPPPPPPPPPMPNFNSVKENDSSDEETLFPTEKTSTMVQPRALPQLPPFPVRKPLDTSDDDDDDDDNLFSVEKPTQVSTRVLPPTKVKPLEESDDDDDNLFAPSTIQSKPKIAEKPSPKAKPRVEKESDDDDESLLPSQKPTTSVQTRALPQLPPFPIRKPLDESTDDDDDDLFSSTSKASSVKSEPKKPEKPLIVSPKPKVAQEKPSLPPKQTKSESESDDDDENLFGSSKKPSTLRHGGVAVLPPLSNLFKSINNDTENESDDLFAPSKVKSRIDVKPNPKPQESPKPPAPEPKQMVPKQPESKTNSKIWDLDSDDDDDLFSTTSKSTPSRNVPNPLSIPKPNVSEKTADSLSKPTNVNENQKATKENQIVQTRALPQLPSFSSSKTLDDSDDDDDLFAINPKSSLSKPKITEPVVSASPSKVVKKSDSDDDSLFPPKKAPLVEPRTLPRLPTLPPRKPLDKSDTDDDDDDLFSTKKPSSIKPVLPPNPLLSQPKPFEDSDDDDDDLFSTKTKSSITKPSPLKPEVKPRGPHINSPKSKVSDDLFSSDEISSSSAVKTAEPDVEPLKPEPAEIESSKQIETTESDSEDDKLFTRVRPSSIRPGGVRVLPPLPVSETLKSPSRPKATSLKMDSEDEDLFAEDKPPTVKPRSSSRKPIDAVDSSQPKVTETVAPKSTAAKESDDDDELFQKVTVSVKSEPLPQLPPLPIRKPLDESEDTDDDDDLFSTKNISTPKQSLALSSKPEPIKIEQPPANVSRLEITDETPTANPLKTASDSSDDDSMLFTPSHSSKPKPNESATADSVTSKPLPTEKDIDEENLFTPTKPISKRPGSVAVLPPLPKMASPKVDDDSDDLFKPPAVKPRKSLKTATKPQETLPSESDSEPKETTKKEAKKKPTNIWDLDSDDDDLFK